LDGVPGTNAGAVWLDHGAADPNRRFKFFACYRAGTGAWPRRPPAHPAGRALEPFTPANGVPLTGDSAKQGVAWSRTADPRALAGKPVRFRFEMSGGGPGFGGSKDTTGASS
jgi:hypothetical protein